MPGRSPTRLNGKSADQEVVLLHEAGDLLELALSVGLTVHAKLASPLQKDDEREDRAREVRLSHLCRRAPERP